MYIRGERMGKGNFSKERFPGQYWPQIGSPVYLNDKCPTHARQEVLKAIDRYGQHGWDVIQTTLNEPKGCTIARFYIHNRSTGKTLECFPEAIRPIINPIPMENKLRLLEMQLVEDLTKRINDAIDSIMEEVYEAENSRSTE
jgi:hypothetical protein